MLATKINTSRVTNNPHDYWRDSVASILKLKSFSVQPAFGSAFHAQLSLFKLGKMQISLSSGSPHRSVMSELAQEEVFIVIVQLAGSAKVRQDEREAIVRPGSICLCNLGHPFEVISSSDYERVCIYISGKELREVFPACSQITATEIAAENGAGVLFLDIVKSLHKEIDCITSNPAVDQAIADVILKSLCAVLYLLPLSQDVFDSRIEVYHRERIKSFVKANLRTNLSIESIARAVGLSGRHVHELFSNESLSLMKWVWAERLEHCRRDLTSAALQGRSVSEIAYSWGFNDPAHFSRAFKARFGKSPREYREQNLLPEQPVPSKKSLRATTDDYSVRGL